MLVTIIKPFGAYRQGQVVNAADWRNRERMFQQRKIRLATKDEIAKAKQTA